MNPITIHFKNDTKIAFSELIIASEKINLKN